MGDLDHRQVSARELGGQALDQLLVAVVRGAQVERRLAQLDRQDEDEPEEEARQGEDRHEAAAKDVSHREAACCHVEADTVRITMGS